MNNKIIRECVKDWLTEMNIEKFHVLTDTNAAKLRLFHNGRYVK